jgi:hypothetical protein
MNTIVKMKVAAYQPPLHATRSTETALGLIREQVERCELQGVEILCCPEGVLGGLADYAPRPGDLAVDAEGGELDALLAPLANDRVATIVGFTDDLHPEGAQTGLTGRGVDSPRWVDVETVEMRMADEPADTDEYLATLTTAREREMSRKLNRSPRRVFGVRL